MKKKIGLLTMPLLDNYGGIIQIAALYHFLQKEGHEPFLIDKKYNQSNGKVLMKRLLSNNPFYKLFDYNKHTQRKKYLKNIQAFIDQFFENRTQKAYNDVQLKNSIQKLETIIVGSDQVWRYKYVKENYKHYFLNFVGSNQKRISYAASFGVDFWEGNDESVKNVKNYMEKFDAISVREDVGVQICENTFDYKNALHVLDPTFLPELDFYNSIIDQDSISKKIGIFNYVLDVSKTKNEIIQTVSNSLGLDVSTIHLEEKINAEKLKPSISEWLYHLRNADFIITDSFHGMVFSIIFNKQFIAIGNRERGASRFRSLLNQLNLESRLVFEGEEFDLNVLITNAINYNEVNEKLKIARDNSKNYLLNNI